MEEVKISLDTLAWLLRAVLELADSLDRDALEEIEEFDHYFSRETVITAGNLLNRADTLRNDVSELAAEYGLDMSDDDGEGDEDEH